VHKFKLLEQIVCEEEEQKRRFSGSWEASSKKVRFLTRKSAASTPAKASRSAAQTGLDGQKTNLCTFCVKTPPNSHCH
jgi:hypothetical protein